MLQGAYCDISRPAPPPPADPDDDNCLINHQSGYWYSWETCSYSLNTYSSGICHSSTYGSDMRECCPTSCAGQLLSQSMDQKRLGESTQSKREVSNPHKISEINTRVHTVDEALTKLSATQRKRTRPQQLAVSKWKQKFENLKKDFVKAQQSNRADDVTRLTKRLEEMRRERITRHQAKVRPHEALKNARDGQLVSAAALTILCYYVTLCSHTGSGVTLCFHTDTAFHTCSAVTLCFDTDTAFHTCSAGYSPFITLPPTRLCRFSLYAVSSLRKLLERAAPGSF